MLGAGPPGTFCEYMEWVLQPNGSPVTVGEVKENLNLPKSVLDVLPETWTSVYALIEAQPVLEPELIDLEEGCRSLE